MQGRDGADRFRLKQTAPIPRLLALVLIHCIPWNDGGFGSGREGREMGHFFVAEVFPAHLSPTVIGKS